MQNRETRGRWSRLAETAEKEEAGRRNSIPEMKKNIASTAGIAIDQINIKATTTEKLGFAGREEGIAAYAVALMVKNV